MRAFSCDGLWLRIGHVQHGGHSASGRCPAFGLHVGLVRIAWVPEMHMRVNDARQEHASLCIRHLIGRTDRLGIAAAQDFFDMVVLDEQGTLETLAFVDDGSILNERAFVHGYVQKLSGFARNF